MIVGLFPELLAAGGIQRAGKQVGAVLAEHAEKNGTPYRFLSLNDPRGDHRARAGEVGFTVRGFSREKLRFAAAAFRLSLKRPRLAVAVHPNLAPVAWAMTLLAPCLRVLVFTHGIEVWTPLSRLRRRALRRSTMVLAPSADTASKLAAVQGVPENLIRRLPWGLDPEFFSTSAQQANHLPPGFPTGRVLLTVARLDAGERYKGVDTLIQALPRIQPASSDVRLAVVGDGDDRPRLEAMAREMGVQERVHFLGALPTDALVPCYRRCDVFALPSGGEGFGLAFLEAMALGKAVVGGARGGTPDVIEEGVTGFLVPPGDVGRLAAILQTLLADENLRRGLGQRAKERVETSFLFDQFRSRFLRILEDVCAS